QLPMAQGLAEIYDFIYVDKSRVSVLYAQLFPQGVITNVKTTSQQSFSDTQNLGSDIKIVKAETGSVEGGIEGIEQAFDASWSVPLEVLSRLQALSLARSTLRGAHLGAIVLAEGFLRVIDYASMKNLWEPAMKIAMRARPKGQKVPPAGLNPSEVVNILKGLPQSIHAHFITDDGFLWSSLRASDFVIPSDDLMLKHGGTISGRWKFLYILDTWMDKGDPPDTSTWSGGELTNGVLSAMHGLRISLGRPPGWFGITPLMIFRIVNPPAQQEGPEKPVSGQAAGA
ncbi:MAG: hypothetical protein ACLP56_16105, partial [Candidatus Sulfotelmatobacter sp.]